MTRALVAVLALSPGIAAAHHDTPTGHLQEHWTSATLIALVAVSIVVVLCHGLRR